MIYADYNATYPISEDHTRKVLEQLSSAEVGNPSSIHSHGRKGKNLLEGARQQIASCLGVQAQEIYFTSGATESNNLVLRSLCRNRTSKQCNGITSPAEHPSVYQTILEMESRGYCRKQELTLDHSGQINLDHLLSLVDETTDFLTLIHVNNETGIVQPVKEISQRVKDKAPKIHIHVDQVQALGKLNLSQLSEYPIDSASFSAHKVGGLPGIGCLYLKKKSVKPLFFGGGQENKLRPGTENLMGAISFGLRAEFLQKTPQWLSHLTSLKSELTEGLNQLPGITIHGRSEQTASNTLSFHMEGFDRRKILLAFDLAGISIASGSACSSGVIKPSPVLKSMGLSDEIATHSLRLSFGEETTRNHIKKILEVIRKLKKTSHGSNNPF